MKNYTKKVRNTIMATAIASLVIAAGLYVYMYRHTISLVDDVMETRESLTVEEKGLSANRSLLALSESTEEERSSLISYFVPADDVVGFIQALESVGAVTGATVAISAISADNIERSAPGTVGKITARVAVSGSWSALMRTLELVEALPYRNTVGGVTLATSVITDGKGSATRSGWSLTFDIVAATLVRPRPATTTISTI